MKNIIYWAVVCCLILAAAGSAYILVRPDSQPSLPVAGPADNSPSPAEVAKVLQNPTASSSNQIRLEHFDLAKKLAQNTDALDLTGCVAKPVVVEIAENAKLLIKNNDAGSHQFKIDPKHHYAIPANSSLNILVEFGYGPGLYGYACDQNSIVGYILVDR